MNGPHARHLVDRVLYRDGAERVTAKPRRVHAHPARGVGYDLKRGHDTQ
ncbi:hypothetical protein G155_00252 [Mycobacterium sp. VKM Ac-1817D]|nr:hypothetical protein G155_00252 [Mycobacterium sp. VKM Ac-1817D]